MEKIIIPIVVGCIIAAWVQLYVWVENPQLEALMIITAIIGATRSRRSCKCQSEGVE